MHASSTFVQAPSLPHLLPPNPWRGLAAGNFIIQTRMLRASSLVFPKLYVKWPRERVRRRTPLFRRAALVRAGLLKRKFSCNLPPLVDASPRSLTPAFTQCSNFKTHWLSGLHDGLRHLREQNLTLLGPFPPGYSLILWDHRIHAFLQLSSPLRRCVFFSLNFFAYRSYADSPCPPLTSIN